MRCQICNTNEATIHLTEINDGVRSEMHICENCAVEQGIAVKSQIPINQLLSNLLASAPSEKEMLDSIGADGSCPDCGFTLADFHKGSLLGCPSDYKVFENALLPLIEKTQNGSSSHCGKVPSSIPDEAKELIEITNLRRRLDASVKTENYELAAELRDKISQITNKGN